MAAVITHCGTRVYDWEKRPLLWRGGSGAVAYIEMMVERMAE
jgi:hypothetical protein